MRIHLDESTWMNNYFRIFLKNPVPKHDKFIELTTKIDTNK